MYLCTYICINVYHQNALHWRLLRQITKKNSFLADISRVGRFKFSLTEVQWICESYLINNVKITYVRIYIWNKTKQKQLKMCLFICIQSINYPQQNPKSTV